MNGYYQQQYYNSHDSRKSQRSHHQYFQHPAFGGTLSPMLRRQRAFHDAIYEEEYGSDQEDECCQSRGMSAVFCWFLSVIILIGLAASVVLTVFFILKSKSHMSKNGELDLFLDGDHGISYHMPDTTTELNSNLDFSSSAASSKEASIPSSISIEDDDNNDETENNFQFGTLNKSAPKSSITSTTRFPPSRKGPTEISDEKVLRPDTSRSAETTRRTSSEPSRTSPETRQSTTERQKSDESKSHESSNIHTFSSTEDHQGTMYTTTTTGAPVQQILFTSSPDIIVTPTGHRRNLQTTRFPTGRTSFSTSTPAFVGTQKDEDDDNISAVKTDDDEENKSQNPLPVVTTEKSEDDEDNDDDEEEDENTDEDKTQEEPHLTLTTRQEEPVTSPSTIVESREQTTEADSYKTEESQLNKMLLDEIPPHDSSQRKEAEEEEEDSPEEKDSSEEETSQSPTYSSEFNLPATTTASRPTTTATSTYSTFSTSSSSAAPPPPAKDNVRLDPLARLIKNLAPKWGRNRTVETTTLSSGSHKYDFTISSREKDNKSKTSQESTTPDYSRTKSKFKSKETSTRSTLLVTPEGTRTRFQGSRPNSPAVETVSILKSPDLSRRHDQEPENSEGVGQFLDILVGSDDHKTLITKQTEDGIVTSAILPPWFNNPKGSNNGKMKENATSTSTTTTTTSTSSTPPPAASNSPGETSSEEETSYSGSASEEGSGSDTASVFGGLFDLFKKEVAASITPTTTNTPTTLPNGAPVNPPDYDPKRIILKRPGGELLAQGSSNFVQNSGGNTNGILNGEKATRKPALSFRDMIRTAAPSLFSTTTMATVDPAVVTDDITSANNNFHFNSPDGGTNIYGYYPDEDDKEQDKTVEHLGVQSESMSDEVIDRVNPSHSIEVQVPDESAEIVITHDNGSSADPKFGETPAESTNHGKYVEPPIFHGGGIRRPLEEDEDLLTHGDLEVDSSETHPVFAVPINATSAASSPANNNKNNTVEVATTKRVSYVSPSGTISREVVDNSAEKDPAPNSGGIGSLEYEDDASLINPQNPQVSSVEKAQSPTGTGGSYEEDLSGNGAHETPNKDTKWSEQDKYGSTEADPSPSESIVESHEIKDTAEPGDTNDVLERKPVVNLDEKLYPDSTGDTSGGTSLSHESEEGNKVHQVFPEGQSSVASSTTERPAGESSLSQPDSSDASKSHENKGFMPPTPVSFHDNKYTFSPPPPDSIYQSKDGWRPIMKNDGAESSRPVSTQTPFWRTRQPILIPTRQPISPSTPPATNSANTNDPGTKPLANGSSQQLLEEDEEYEEEEEEEVGNDGVPQTDAHDQEINNYSWGNREHLMEQPQSNSQLPSKVKFPEQTQEDFDQDIEPQPQKLQVQQHLQQQPHPIQMMTQPHPSSPHQQQQIPQMQQQQHPQQHQQQRPHPQQSHPQQQRPIPKQMQHPPPHHVTHQQRQQFLYQNNQNNQHNQQNIDRSKYLMRPAPPPIVMRRAPIQNMPYLPSRDGPNRQGLVAQVVPPQNQAAQQSDPSPSEFHLHPQYNLRRRFKTLGARPRSSNLNWPAEETSGSDSITAREPVGERRAAG